MLSNLTKLIFTRHIKTLNFFLDFVFKAVVMIGCEMSDSFEVMVGVHQDLVFHPLLFVVVLELEVTATVGIVC